MQSYLVLSILIGLAIVMLMGKFVYISRQPNSGTRKLILVAAGAFLLSGMAVAVALYFVRSASAGGV